MSCSCGCTGCGTPDAVRTRCQCCQGTDFETPVPIHNPPGLSELEWRVGTQARFAASMRAGIRRTEALGRLGTRRPDDWTIGAIDAWASALDVLGFHQERYGQELFLRTADERRSVLELSNLIGYQLGPGVAARVALAFGMAKGPGVPTRVTVPVGTKAASLPRKKDELPQTFETSEEIEADVRFARLHPRQKAEPGPLTVNMRAFWLQGVNTGLEEGDPLLLVVTLELSGIRLLRVRTVEPRLDEDRTLVRCDAVQIPDSVPVDPALPSLRATFAATGVAPGFMTDEELHGWLDYLPDWDMDRVIAAIEAAREEGQAFDPTDFGPGLFALEISARPFGHNAPMKKSLSPEMQGAFPGDWDVGVWSIGRTASRANVPDDHHVDETLKHCIHLDQSHPEILGTSWVALESPMGAYDVKRVLRAGEESVVDFGLSGKASRLQLMGPGGEDVDHLTVGYGLRTTSVLCGSRRLELAPMPIERLPAGTSDLLLEEVVPHLEPGRRLIFEGELLGQPGIRARESARVKDLLQGSHTWIFLEEGLANAYSNATVTIHGNVADATHGESHGQPLGSGDGSKAHQTFRLPQNPLTHTAAPVPGGAEANLEIRVNGVLWQRVPSLYTAGPCDRVYTLRQDDGGRSWVRFGDGQRGARLPTGAENVVAHFRVGLGTPGLVEAGQISLLPNPPLGVREVLNPLASADAEDPESRDDARENAPATVRTLDRVVSLRDYEDFARSYAGVAKARADRVWDGQRLVVYLSLAGNGGADPSSELIGELRTALDGSRDGRPPVRLGPFLAVRFTLEAKLKVASDYLYADVETAARAALRQAFAFEARGLGQSVRASEIMAVLHGLAGVVAVDVDALTPVIGTADSDAHGLVGTPARYLEAVASQPGRIEAARLLHLAADWAEPLQLSELR